MFPLFPITRREVLARLGGGFGGLALSALLGDYARASDTAPVADLAPKPAHFPAKAKAVIQLFMHGGPSHVDLLDPKPMLAKYDGKPAPTEAADDEKITGNLLKCPYKFKQYGESGLEFAETLPHIGAHADDIAVIRSMYTGHRNHEQALWMMHTGLTVAGRPTIGAWAAYALGTLNQNLPAYIVLPDPRGLPVDGIRNWSSGWLPPVYQGTSFRSEGVPVLNLRAKAPRSADVEQGRLQLLSDLNADHKARHPGELELDARISGFELAARMQLAATDALDVSRETTQIQQLYGFDNPTTRPYGARCLMARRLVERGVRFVQVFMSGQPWDAHTNAAAQTRGCCEQTDLPIAGLLTDLKQRGLLETTLVFWGGEFGRTPGAQGKDGRDHHPYGFSVWLAGGGVKGGQVYGATDDFGYRAVVDRCSTADLHATMLHLLGLDHSKVVYRHNGRDERLTDVFEPKILKTLLV
jgi:Protein of unknown function (DUF1501)